jgi:hypothetical protein
MATAKYAHCAIRDIRNEVERRLELPAAKSEYEKAWDFWKRVNDAGMLIKALALYDRIAAGWAEQRQVRREPKQQFWQRIDREGRREEAERVLNKMLASHMSQREAQEKLVERFQPLDGSRTRVWETPDPWEHGRLFQSKEVQDETLALAEDDESQSEKDIAQNRIWWARVRREEAEALAAWRRWGQKLKADARRCRRQAKATGQEAEASGSAT